MLTSLQVPSSGRQPPYRAAAHPTLPVAPPPPALLLLCCRARRPQKELGTSSLTRPIHRLGATLHHTKAAASQGANVPSPLGLGPLPRCSLPDPYSVLSALRTRVLLTPPSPSWHLCKVTACLPGCFCSQEGGLILASGHPHCQPISLL